MIGNNRNAFSAVMLMMLFLSSACSPSTRSAEPVFDLYPTRTIHPSLSDSPLASLTSHFLPSPSVTPSPAHTPTPLPTTTSTPIPYEVLIETKEEIGIRIPRMVFAAYQGWFGSSKWTNWNHWEWQPDDKLGHDPDRILMDGRRDIASVFYPLVGPYDSSDPELIEYHIRFAQASGIDAYVVDWYGYRDLPSTDFEFQDVNFELMLKISEELGFSLAVLYEPKIHYNGWIPHNTRDDTLKAVIADLDYLLDNHAHSPSYLNVDGVPLIFVFDTIGLSVHEWQFVVDELESNGHVFVLVSDYPLANYFGPFSGLWGWINYWGVVYYGYQNRPDIWEGKINKALASSSRNIDMPPLVVPLSMLVQVDKIG